jgi:hypothetical protein
LLPDQATQETPQKSGLFAVGSGSTSCWKGLRSSPSAQLDSHSATGCTAKLSGNVKSKPSCKNERPDRHHENAGENGRDYLTHFGMAARAVRSKNAGPAWRQSNGSFPARTFGGDFADNATTTIIFGAINFSFTFH